MNGGLLDSGLANTLIQHFGKDCQFSFTLAPIQDFSDLAAPRNVPVRSDGKVDLALLWGFGNEEAQRALTQWEADLESPDHRESLVHNHPTLCVA